MSKDFLKIKIAYLYPDILQGDCDKGNLDTFVNRCAWRNIDAKVTEICVNDKIVNTKFDFYYIGGTNYEQMDSANEILLSNKEELTTATDIGIPMLGVGCGYLLLGNTYQFNNSKKVNGLKILDIDSVENKAVNYGYLVGTCEFLNDRTIVGFENHSMATKLKSGSFPFVKLQKGHGNNGEDLTEGARTNNVIGTNLSSPVLAQNPYFCDFLISTALRIKYKGRIPIAPLYDDIETYSHSYIVDMK